MDREYYRISKEALGKAARLPILKLGDAGEVFFTLALEMVETIKRNNEAKKHTALICPVGPVGQYPIFVRLVNQTALSLRDCWFFNMDEYLTEEDAWIDTKDPLSFRGFMQREVYENIRPELRMPEEQRIFPDPRNPASLPALIRKLGGVDLCIGGIGINGHLAFNEPQPEMMPEEFADLPTRMLNISQETRAVNAVGSLGGALECMPTRCVTIGMREMLGAKRLRLACFRDWHRAVVRRAAYGEVSAAFPATMAQRHPDAQLIITELASECPL